MSRQDRKQHTQAQGHLKATFLFLRSNFRRRFCSSFFFHSAGSHTHAHTLADTTHTRTHTASTKRWTPRVYSRREERDPTHTADEKRGTPEHTADENACTGAHICIIRLSPCLSLTVGPPPARVSPSSSALACALPKLGTFFFFLRISFSAADHGAVASRLPSATGGIEKLSKLSSREVPNRA